MKKITISADFFYYWNIVRCFVSMLIELILLNLDPSIKVWKKYKNMFFTLYLNICHLPHS